ncbi:GNAT family N-acetyltransferase [Haloimpatiens massiliensis]|uniref:GNAT family N-acetyltransferase n=1 Tax=Haloimpatiens massiliensis TaxID=1658110 RepID=UPI000C83576D|nr:GNAT family N-acetyltransferase [Haloimpatiens massiliensis]
MELRSARREDFEEVLKLINHVFRDTRGENSTMGQEFPLLLNINNIGNMIGIYENNKPVSEVNFLKEKIYIESATINAASIGGVCTHENFRGKNYASRILDRVEEKMYKDGVDVVLISGERTLYTRRQCMKVKNFYKYTITPENLGKPHMEKNAVKSESNLCINKYQEKYFDSMVQIYNLNSTRYKRTFKEFSTLLRAATIPWGSYTYDKYVITRDDEFLGYIILRIINDENKYGQVIECAGKAEYIHECLKRIAYEKKLSYINCYVHIKDTKGYLSISEERELDCLHGTVKIINFKSFMENLKPYFYQYVEEEIVDKFKFVNGEDGLHIIIEDEDLKIPSIGIATKLVFEGVKDKGDLLEETPKVKKFINKVFPIPFVWTANLNYQ